MPAATDPRLKECSALAFYGIDPGPEAAERFYKTVVGWFDDLGHPPDKLSVGGPGQSGKLGAFSRGNGKLLKEGFANVSYFDVVATLPEAQIFGRDYYLIAGENREPNRLVASVVARSSLAGLTPESLLPLARVLAEVLRPAYGVGFRREHALGPELYVLGVNKGQNAAMSGEAYEEKLNVSRWGDLGMPRQVYRQGLLRDVFPWNFLTAPLLDRPLGPGSLAEWIRKDERRGVLGPVSDGVSLWQVPESSIPAVRRELREAGAVFDWKKFV